MANYKLSTTAKKDLIRIYHYGVHRYGVIQAEKYYNSFFEYFNQIAERPFSYESVDFIKKGYRRCVCGSDSIYFKISKNTIDIMTIIGRQDFNKKL